MTDTPVHDALVSRITHNLQQVRAEIAQHSAGQPVAVLGVTKTLGPDVVRAAFAAGLHELGENYAQELAAKSVEHRDLGVRWHFIGGLQRNKIKRFGDAVAVWQTIDRIELLDELAKRAPGAELFIQVNTTGEPQKSGCEPEETAKLVDHGRTLGLVVRGLMTVGPTDAGADPRPSFSQLRSLGETVGTTELSMGMSGDYQLAVAEGSTLVRIGSTLFGERPARQS
ncbi:MAG: YggS family pyridoxal phosphate-dependent enzyme [Acidimicrobiales bacterium]